MPTALDRIMEFHWRFPRAISYCIDKPYGVIYYDPDNPDLHDGNHAVIRQGGDAEAIVADIAGSFRDLGIQPRIYSDLSRGRLAAIREALARQGFVSEQWDDDIFMALRRAHTISMPATLRFARAAKLDDSLGEITLREDGGGMWNIKRLTKMLALPWYHYLAGYDGDGRTVTVCAVEHFMPGIARIADVVTHPDCRGRGYGRQLMRFAVEYCARLELDLLFLSTDNPTAIKIYKEAGFEELPNEFENWQAWLDRS